MSKMRLFAETVKSCFAKSSIHAFFISSTFISNARLKLAKKSSNTLILNFYYFSKIIRFPKIVRYPYYHPKKRRFLKNAQKISVSVLIKLYD